MRFTIRNLCWLTITVAIAAALVRILGGVQALGGVVIFGGFVFAPLLLALVSSFFQGISARTRKRIAYVILAILAAIPTLIAILASPGFGLFVGFLIFALWLMQIDIFNDLHRKRGVRADSD